MARPCFQFQSSGYCTYGERCKFSHSYTTPYKRPAISTRSWPKGTKKRIRNKPKYSGHIWKFFAQYSDFDYDPSNSSSWEFYRLCEHFDWDKEDPERRGAHEEFKDALVQDFNQIFGTDEEDLESWHRICVVLDISDLPLTISDAKKMFRGLYVNLVDLVDARDSGTSVFQFSNLEELKAYTVESGKFFPRESAYAGGLLRFFLREIIGQYEGRKKTGKQHKRR